MAITKKPIFFPSILLMTAYACGQDVHYNYDRGTNFTSYKTYQWVNAPTDAPSVPTGAPNLPSYLPALHGFPSIPGGLPNVPGGAATVRAVGQRISCSTRTLSGQSTHNSYKRA